MRWRIDRLGELEPTLCTLDLDQARITVEVYDGGGFTSGYAFVRVDECVWVIDQAAEC